jgi:hypothetical protein
MRRSETFALFTGLACLVLGLFGFMSLTVNVPSSAVHLALGAWGITAWRRITSPRVFCAALAIVFAALAVMELIPGANALLGMAPSQGLDAWLHGGAAALGAYIAWHPELSVEHRASGASDRRQHDQPVEQDRRRGHADRRLPSSSEEI